MFKWIGGVALLALLAGVIYFFGILPPRVDENLNVVLEHEPYQISDEAQDLHRTLRVADLHSDMLLWKRDPLIRHKRGHTDIPRLAEGGFRVQVFSAVTKTPKNLNYDKNSADTDNITLVAIAQLWPLKTWTSIAERALYQAAVLTAAADRSNGALIVARNKGELRDGLESDALVGVLATEGAHPLEGKIENLDRLYEVGYRILGLQHFFDNELGGSLHGQSNAGLTPFGVQAVTEAVSRGMIIDVAHSSEAVAWEVLSLIDRPVIVSHTGLKGHCDSARNVSDELMQAIAAAGGLIGVGFWDGAVCNPEPDSIASAIVYAIELVGVDHVALGSDYDGTVTTYFDASEIAVLTDALLRAGVSETDVAKVMGENQIAFLLANLPQ